MACIVGYYGGLRTQELRSIEFGKVNSDGDLSFEVDRSGYWFTFQRVKQREITEFSTFCVPRRQPDWAAPLISPDRTAIDFDPASVIDQYLAVLEADLNLTRDKLTGSFFKSAQGKKGKKFSNVPMGKNTLAKIAFEFADELFLPNPHLYTGHCWRRSCGTNASDAGCNVTTLMAQLGWKTPKTAIGYVKKSRLTSFQMSMFLSNVQRQNKDLDSVLESVAPAKIAALRQKRKRESATKTVALDASAGQPSSEFSRKFFKHSSRLAASDSVEKSDIVSLLSAPVDPSLYEIHSETHSSEMSDNGAGSVLKESVGGGVAEPGKEAVGIGGGGESGSGGGLSLASPLSHFDPRLSSILNNLHNHGQIHVHFNFGAK